MNKFNPSCLHLVDQTTTTFGRHTLQHRSVSKAFKVTKDKRQIDTVTGAKFWIGPIRKFKDPSVAPRRAGVLRPLPRRRTKDFFTKLLTCSITLRAGKRGHFVTRVA